MKLLSMMPITPLLALAAWAAPLVARAAETTTVTFRAVCFDPRESETPEFFVTDGGSRKPLEIDKSRLSDPQKASVRDGRFVDFFTSKEVTPGELPPVTLALPAESGKDLLFVFAPSGTGYRAWAIKLSPADFKPGATLMVNAAPMEVAVKMGETAPAIVEPGSSKILPIPDGFKEPMLPVQIFNRRDKSEQWQIAQSTRWAVDLRFRSYVFFYQAPDRPQLMLHGVTERLGSPEEKQ